MRHIRRFIYQSRTGPVLEPSQRPEQVTESRWHQPLSEPQRQRQPRGYAAALIASGVVISAHALTLPEAVSADKWAQPLSTPQTLARPGLPAHQQQAVAFVYQPPAAETVTPDKWFVPLAEPRRSRPALLAGQHEERFECFAEAVTVDRFGQPLSIPVRISRLAPAAQPATFFTPAAPFNEAVSLDKWLRPLSEPVRVRPALLVGDQQAFAFVKADPFSEASDAGKWYRPLGEPVVKAKPGLRTGQQQSFIFAQPEDVTVGKWLQPLSEPRRSRPSLLTGDQQHTALVQAAPFAESVSADRFAQPISQPTLRKRTTQPDAVSCAPYVEVASETVTLDKWQRPLSEPMRRIGLSAALQDCFAFAQAAPFGETINPDKWYAPLAEPSVKSKPSLSAAEQQAVAFVAPQVLAGWQQPFDEPTLRRGLPAAQQQAFAFVKAAPFAETVSVDRWLRPLSEPLRLRRPVAYQLPSAFWPYPIPNVDAPVGYGAIYPDRALRKSLPVGDQQHLAFVKAAPFAESVTADRWWRPLSEPRRSALPVAARQAIIAGPALPYVAGVDAWGQPLARPTYARPRTQPQGAILVKATPFAETVTADRWLQPSSQPPRRLRSAQPDSVEYTPYVAAAETVTLDKWIRPLNEPTRRVGQRHPQVFAYVPLPRITAGWQQPFDEPTLRRGLPVALQQSLAACPNLPLSPSLSGWLQPLSLPVFITPRVQPPAVVYLNQPTPAEFAASLVCASITLGPAVEGRIEMGAAVDAEPDVNAAVDGIPRVRKC